MRDHDRTTGEVQQRFFQCAQGFHVEVVGGFVEQQDIAATLQEFRQMYPVAFTAGQVADMLLLITPGEVET